MSSVKLLAFLKLLCGTGIVSPLPTEAAAAARYSIALRLSKINEIVGMRLFACTVSLKSLSSTGKMTIQPNHIKNAKKMRQDKTIATGSLLLVIIYGIPSSLFPA